MLLVVEIVWVGHTMFCSVEVDRFVVDLVLLGMVVMLDFDLLREMPNWCFLFGDNWNQSKQSGTRM